MYGSSRPPHSPWLSTIIILLVLAVYQAVEVSVNLRTLRTLYRLEHPEAVEYSYSGNDRPNRLPISVPHVGMNTEWPDDELYGLYADDEWYSLFPRSHGWVALGPKSEIFAVSMYHQLHCLDALRFGYVSAKAGALVFPGNGTEAEHHVNHCLTYLREMVMCSADVTLETSHLGINPEGKIEHGATGMDIVHQCRDWTKIRAYMEENFDERVRRGEIKENGELIL